MTKRQIDVLILPDYRAAAGTAWVRKVAIAALQAGDPGGTSGASIVLTDADALHDLNLRYRGLDESTDVLSFGHDSESGSPGVGFPDPPGEESLGDVVVSYPHAEAQAAERGVPTERELALLIVHGMLHLLGHDHAELAETAAMQALETQALGLLFTRVPA